MPSENREAHWILSADKKRIVFDLYRREHLKVVIIAHGFFNSKNSVLLQDLGQALNETYDVIIMDFRGHGESGGLYYWTAKEHEDLQAVLAFARERYTRVAVIGFSLGAATSLIAAQKTGYIDSLVCVSGPTAFEKIDFHFWDLDVETDILFNIFGKGHTGKGVRPGPFWLQKQQPINIVGEIKTPVFFLHGEADWLIRPWHSRELFEKATGKKKLAVLKNGPHAEYLMRNNREETLTLIKGWLKETL